MTLLVYTLWLFWYYVNVSSKLISYTDCNRLGHLFVTSIFPYGAIQKLRGQYFDHFCQPTYLNVDIFYPKRGQKEAFLDHLPTSSCPRSFWTTPKVINRDPKWQWITQQLLPCIKSFWIFQCHFVPLITLGKKMMTKKNCFLKQFGFSSI